MLSFIGLSRLAQAHTSSGRQYSLKSVDRFKEKELLSSKQHPSRFFSSRKTSNLSFTPYQNCFALITQGNTFHLGIYQQFQGGRSIDFGRRTFSSKKDDDDEEDLPVEEKKTENEKEKETKEKDTKTPESEDNEERQPSRSLMTIGKPINALRNAMEIQTPSKVLVLPLFKRPFFPGMTNPISVASLDFVNVLNSWQKAGGSVGLFLSKSDDHTINDVKNIHSVGILGRLHNIDFGVAGFKTPAVFVSGAHRIKITSVDQANTRGGKIVVNVEKYKDEPFDKKDREIQAYSSEIVYTMREILQYNHNNSQYGILFQEQLSGYLGQYNMKEPGELADLAAAISTAPGNELQEVLDIVDIKKRQRRALELLKVELERIKAQSEIKKKLEDSLTNSTRRYQLNEQLKIIKKELGMEQDEKQSIIEKFQKRLEGKQIPEEALKVIHEEFSKLSTLESSSSEFNVSKNYLDWLTVLPWNTFNQESFDVSKAEVVLDEDHYGLKDVKKRILEVIAVGKLIGKIQGKILCFVGPPGVGKTSIGKSIARSLNREFFRFSVGGMYDVAEFKGHRRTYIGAMPGKLVQCMKQVKSSNPVVLIDEIDKLGRGHYGDPASALLEILDPEQNKSFLDHYLDVPYDLSRVLFVCTANTQDTIPGPLLDRMEVIQLSGYVVEEKMQIAETHLIPTAKESCGLVDKNVTLKSEAIRALIKGYCRESGVRSLQKYIDKIFRKVAFKIVKGQEGKIVIGEKDLHSYVGKPLFNIERYYDVTPIGVVMGLAYTSLGGATLYIETTVDRLSGKGALHKITGQLGEVMKESSEIAYTFVKSFIEEVSIGNRFFEGANIHMHVPEGATPKDGPSAGVTMVTALMSLALNKSVRPDLAMTGEITLTGKLLPIGGVKEKTIAAKRNGVTHIIFPKDNKKDFDELDETLKSDLIVHYADYYRDVYKIALEYDDPNNKESDNGKSSKKLVSKKMEVKKKRTKEERH